MHQIETPAPMSAPLIDGKKLVLTAILRAGVGLLDGMLQILPSARVGHVGLYRDPDTLEAVKYYFKLPQNMEDQRCHLGGSHVGNWPFRSSGHFDGQRGKTPQH